MMRRRIRCCSFEKELVEVARVQGAHGTRGSMRVLPTTAMPGVRLMQEGWRWLRKPGEMMTKKVWMEGGMEISRGMYSIRLRDVNGRDDAEGWIGAVLLALEDERPVLNEEEEVYHDRLMGTMVWKEKESIPGNEKDVESFGLVPNEGTHIYVGKVIGVLEGTGTYDTLRVSMDKKLVLDMCETPDALPSDADPLTALIPFAKEIVVRLDVEGGYMIVDPPQGLLELCLVGLGSKKKKKKKGKRRRPQQKGDRNVQEDAV